MVVVATVAVVLAVTVRVVERLAPPAIVRLAGRTLQLSPVPQAAVMLRVAVIEKLPWFETEIWSVRESVPETGLVIETLA